MALSVLSLFGYPAFGGATNVDASSFTFTNGVSTTNAGSYIVGYMDGENRAKYFYTDGATIALPTLTQVSQVSIVDAAGSTKAGAYYVTLSYSAGSPDATSANGTIFLDEFGLLIKASTAYG
jgi:hypothetical protein